MRNKISLSKREIERLYEMSKDLHNICDRLIVVTDMSSGIGVSCAVYTEGGVCNDITDYNTW